MYHQIKPPEPNSSLIISAESFSRQINWLERNKFRFLSLDEVVDLNGKSPLFDRTISITFDDGFLDNFENGFPPLIRQQKSAALFVVVNWVGQKGFMTWKEIRELSSSGVTIGSHSLTHRWLPRVSNDVELRSEVFDSKKKIEDETGKKVSHFSYPVGGVDERVADLVQQAGYRAAWVAGAKPTVSIAQPQLCFRRIKVTPSDTHLSRFAVKAYGLKGIFR